MITKNEMKFLVPCMPDRRNGIRKQGEMIREGMGHALAVPDTGNGTARRYPPAARTGAQGGVFTGLGSGVFVDQDPLPTPPGPLLHKNE